MSALPHTIDPEAPPPPLAHRSSFRAETALIGVYEVSKLLASPNRLEFTLAGVLALLSSFLDMHHGLIALLGPSDDFEMVVGSGWSEANAKRYFARLPERAIGQIVATKMPLVVANVATDPLFVGVDLSGWGAADGAPFSLIGVPIKDGNDVIGTLTIDRMAMEPGMVRFDEDVRFLTMIANLVGQTLRLHKVVAQDRDRLMAEQRRLAKELSAVSIEPKPVTATGIVGQSPALQVVLDKVRTVARSRSTVLLRGESGTGKELFANAIHTLSPRAEGPFIKVNCAALPESVLESELFGHEKGAFTGAITQRKGRFEMANGGTLFLDEIGEISASFQAKLLRVLQEGEFERVGSGKPIKVDVRLVCATNRNLEEAVSKGEFRADLYYRINVVPIFLPPLRDRKSDLPLLASEFLRRFNAEHGTSLNLSDSAMQVLVNCYFPGNIRELENCVRRTATLARSSNIDHLDFACHNDGCLSAMLWKGATQATTPPGFVPLPIAPRPVQPAAAAPAPAPASPPRDPQQSTPAGCPSPGACPVPGADLRSERDRLIEAMETAGWVQAKAARILGLTPRQMGYALRKHDIPIKKF